MIYFVIYILLNKNKIIKYKNNGRNISGIFLTNFKHHSSFHKNKLSLKVKMTIHDYSV